MVSSQEQQAGGGAAAALEFARRRTQWLMPRTQPSRYIGAPNQSAVSRFSGCPPELQRADYAVSANICRTIDATRQAVIDVRCCFDWLETQGYNRLGIVGTSLGSCYACLASAHDERISVTSSTTVPPTSPM